MIDANVPENDSEANEPEQNEPAHYSPEAEARLRSELAPEESMFKDWLPKPTPIDGPAPAP
ncbi:hypothetical protein [Agromyces sp. Leaf222]|uniref:hypothetical protein n=1 Tax=Agromyces sp. Leaf222 TaxID=1735688 RepID=UPI0006F3C640|nr:hypothetical protein [Agromyces sp. Leaf222]KQM83047.1 hypothetical protein ASE68_07150 [Agromyces sp. Leaf222]